MDREDFLHFANRGRVCDRREEGERRREMRWKGAGVDGGGACCVINIGDGHVVFITINRALCSPARLLACSVEAGRSSRRTCARTQRDRRHQAMWVSQNSRPGLLFALAKDAMRRGIFFGVVAGGVVGVVGVVVGIVI